MGLTVPTHVPIVFDWYDNMSGEHPWLDRLAFAGRNPQTTPILTGFDVENGLGNQLLRRYAQLVGHTHFAGKNAVVNMTEFKLGGVINIALNQDGLVGLIWNYRPIIPRKNMEKYRAAWRDTCMVRTDDGKRLSSEVLEQQFREFLTRVTPLVGMWSLELARGYAEATKTVEQSAQGEGEEELLVECTSVEFLDLVAEDTAQNPALNAYHYARMDVKGRPTTKRDLWENIAQRAEWLTLGEIYQAVRDGHLIEPYTLTGLKVLEIYMPEVYRSIPV